MPTLDRCIVNASEAAWEEEFLPGTKNKNNCSGFVKAVAKRLGIPLPDTANADGIADVVSKKWTKVASGTEAARLAGTGTFVLAVLKAADHTPARNNGHVAIVASGELYKQKYPVVWGGSIASAQSKGSKTVGEVWNRADRDNVAYYAYGVVACK
jgi:cell wall-associated NlpC family hydrolase